MIQYHINYEKNCVTAVFEGGKDYWARSLYNMLYNIQAKSGIALTSQFTFIETVLDSYQSLCGIAKCHPEDVFDATKGKVLAKARLLKKWYYVKMQVLQKYKEKIHQCVAANDTIISKYS